jgi:phosphotriesterase-related protein
LVKDDVRIASLTEMLRAGHVESLCLSHDATCGAWLGRPSFDGKRLLTPERIARYLPLWDSTHLFKRILPKLRALGVSDVEIHTMLVENPARYFRGETPAVRRTESHA